MSPDGDRPPREQGRFLLRALLAVLIIVLATAGATATAALLKIKDEITPPKSAPPAIHSKEVVTAKPGKPQTILILGSDRRWSDLKKNNPTLTQSNPARSDTILLIRMDPRQEATAVLSIPRDLKVLIPGYGINKINAAYSLGGPDLTAKTLKQLFGGDLKINHIVNVQFKGFRQAVDALGCVYADVDRRYYHSNVGLPVSQHYAEIDIQPGYQRLCGQRALDYVRFRHADSDLVRAARQQDFLRAAKDQISESSLLGHSEDLIKIFQGNTQTDSTLRGDVKEWLKLAKLAIFSSGHPVVQIKFPAVFTGAPDTGEYVEASSDTIAQLRDQFFHASPEIKKDKKAPTAAARRAAVKSNAQRAATAKVVNGRRTGEDLVASLVASHKVGFRLYFPTKLTPQGRYTTVQPSPYAYTLRDRAGRLHHAYRLVVVQDELLGEYYGIQGMDWTSPPALAHPTSTTTIKGRKIELFKSGSRLRYVAWRHGKSVYWVSNTLTFDLTNGQMLAIAVSLTSLAN